jgi:hypothetical protein
LKISAGVFHFYKKCRNPRNYAILRKAEKIQFL